MEKDTYLILRVTGAPKGVYDLLRSSAWRSEDALAITPEVEYRIETQTLEPQDLRNLHRDPQVGALGAFARPMPLQLIHPVVATGPAFEPLPIYDATWGVFVTGALQSPYLGSGVTVAVLDTGIDANHEAFRSVSLIQKDFTGEGDGDQSGHGTHVAGTIFGQTVQGVRYGVAPGIRRALIGKVLGRQHVATTKELVDAIQWAVDSGAQIINMSLGFDFPGLVKWWSEQGMEVDLATSHALAQYRDNVRFFDRLVDLLRARNAQSSSALIVAAAGNESKREKKPEYVIEVSLPAAADGIVAVAALQTSGAPHNTLSVTSFSNTRAAVAAPGVGIYSAKSGGGYTYKHGTSMASPHVAGVAALWAERQLQRNGVVNINTLDAQLRSNAKRDRLPNAKYLDVGEGLIAAPLD